MPIPTPKRRGRVCKQPTSAKKRGRLIRQSVGGTDEHAVIFAGSGSTGAIDRLINILGLRIPSPPR